MTEVEMTTGRNPFHYDPQPWGDPQPYGGDPQPYGDPPTYGDPQPAAGQPTPDSRPAGAWDPFPDAGSSGTRAWPDVQGTPSTLVAGPPVGWLLAAVAVGAVAAVVAGLWGAAVVVALLAWVAAGPVGVGLLGVHSRVDTQRRARSVYTSPSWAPVLYWGAVVVVASGIGLAAWRLAEWVGRL
jgi:hypothetical protein